jgi:prepilin signal peptidase PulO-like enzyme (type II secretory pathway)
LPFGSFLAAGGLFAALFGPGLVEWYVGLLR